MLDKLNTTLRSVPDRLDRVRRHVSSALRRHTFRLDRFQPSSLHDRDRIDVIRHRIRAGLNGQRQLVVALVAVVGLSMAVVTANATVGPDASPASAEAVAATDQERRAAAERADRGERAEPAEPAEQVTDSQTGRGAEPEASPSPEPPPDWVHPMPGARTTSCFGQRWGTLHAGVDLAAPHGTPIHAVGAGTVTHSGWVFGGYGISVVIDHGDGHLTHYAHASETKVSVGDRVEPGDVIALEGSTGDSTGPHLHFEVHKGGLWNAVEPTRWMANRGVEIPGC